MNGRQAAKAFNSLGWVTETDEVNDRWARCDLPDRIARTFYKIRKYGNDQKFDMLWSVSTGEFSTAASFIMGESSFIASLQSINRIGGPVIVPEVTMDHIRQAAEEAIAWAQACDIRKELETKAGLPTDCPGILPVWHLAALVVLKDVTRLTSYQTSFEAGDRLGFVPYITKDYIDRALTLAQERAATT